MLFILILIALLSQFNGLFGQDSYEYMKLERAITHHFISGETITNSVFPIGYALIGSIVQYIFQDDIFAMQCISMVSLCIAFFYFKKLLYLLYGAKEEVNYFAIIFFLLSPYMLRFGLLVMSDMLCIMLYLIFLYYTFLYLKTYRTNELAIAAIVATCCIFVRYASVVAVSIPVCYVLYHLIKQKHFFKIFLCVFLFLLFSLPELILRHRFIFWNFDSEYAGFAYFYVPMQWSFENFFKHEFMNLDGHQIYVLPNLLFVFENIVHPAFIFCGVFFLFFLKKSDLLKKESILILSVILLYALFAAGYPYQSRRYLLFTFPLVLLIFYPAFLQAMAWCKLERTLKNTILICCLLLQCFLFIISSKTIYSMNKTEKEIAGEIQKTAAGKNIYTFSIDGALNTYQVDYVFFDIYRNIFQEIEPNSMLLFNEPAFNEQFSDLNPVKNFRFIQSQYQLKERATFKNGWKLYDIENK